MKSDKPGVKLQADRDQQRIGQTIASQLEPRMSLREVAARLGIAPNQVVREQNRALYKLAMAMRKLRAEGSI